MTEEIKDTNNIGGAFYSSLTRNNKQIRGDRAASIVEDTCMGYKRKVEDIALRIKKMKRERENMLDLSPTNAISLTLASDFDSEKYIEEDIKLGVNIRNETIKYEIANDQLFYLFGIKLDAI